MSDASQNPGWKSNNATTRGRSELVPGDGEQSQLRGERQIPPPGNPQPSGKDVVAGHDPVRSFHTGTSMEDDAGSLPPLDSGERKSQETAAPQEVQGENLPTPPFPGVGTLIRGRPIPPLMGQREREELLQLGRGRWIASPGASLDSPRKPTPSNLNVKPVPPLAPRDAPDAQPLTGTSKTKDTASQHTPSAAIPPRCKSCGSTMRETDKVPGTFFSRRHNGEMHGQHPAGPPADDGEENSRQSPRGRQQREARQHSPAGNHQRREDPETAVTGRMQLPGTCKH